MNGIAVVCNLTHHENSDAVHRRQDANVIKLKKDFKSTTNPFTSNSKELLHIVTQRVFPDDVQHNMCQIVSVGEQKLKAFVGERIVSNTVSLWSPMKKVALKTCNSACKKVQIKLHEKVVAMKADMSLFSRILGACRSRSDIDLKAILCYYEFSVLPPSLCSPDGSMHHCLAKSKLMGSLKHYPITKKKCPVYCTHRKTCKPHLKWQL